MDILSLDFGTTNFKAYLIDEKGNQKRFVRKKNKGFYEIKRLNEEIANLQSEAEAISITGQSFVPIFLDEKDEILEPIIFYLDKRSAIGYDLLKRKVKEPSYAGTKLFSSLLWFSLSKPDAFKSIKKVMDVKEYIAYLLTGKHTYDSIEISKEEKDAILSYFNLKEDVLGEPHDYQEPVGELMGKQVYVMPSDTRTQLFGSGILSIEKSMADIGGTTEVMGIILKPNYRLKPIMPILYGIPTYFISPPLGYIYDWIERIRGPNNELKADLIVCKFERKKQLWKLKFDLINVEPLEKGSLKDRFLLTIASEVYLFEKKLESKNVEIEKIIVSGGSSVNKELNQLKADFSGKEVLVPSIRDTTIIGSAMILFTNLGKFHDLYEASQSLVKIKEKYAPKRDFSSFTKTYAHYKSKKF